VSARRKKGRRATVAAREAADGMAAKGEVFWGATLNPKRHAKLLQRVPASVRAELTPTRTGLLARGDRQLAALVSAQRAINDEHRRASVEGGSTMRDEPRENHRKVIGCARAISPDNLRKWGLAGRIRAELKRKDPAFALGERQIRNILKRDRK
jgi:hypothetical protein